MSVFAKLAGFEQTVHSLPGDDMIPVWARS